MFIGKLFKVRQRFLQKAGRRHLYETVHHPGSCAILPLVDAKTLLLLRQYRPSVGKTLWEIPAGTLEAGESPLAAARREVEEETGYCASRVTPLAVFYPSPGFCTERIHLFLAEKLRRSSQKLELDEKIRVHAVSFPKAFRLLKGGKIQDAKTLIALHWLSSRVGKRTLK